MLITKQCEIDMGHRLLKHKSKCRHFHGHRYKIELGVDDKVVITKGTSDEGMVIDYGDLKDILKSEIEDKFDHKFVFHEHDFIYERITNGNNESLMFYGIVLVPFTPTAENLAKHWYELCENALVKRDIKIKYLKVWETPNSTATYGL